MCKIDDMLLNLSIPWKELKCQDSNCSKCNEKNCNLYDILIDILLQVGHNRVIEENNLLFCINYGLTMDSQNRVLCFKCGVGLDVNTIMQ